MKIKNFIYILFLCLFGLVNVEAAQITLTSDTNTIKSGESIDVKINLKLDKDEEYNQVDIILNYDNELVSLKYNAPENGLIGSNPDKNNKLIIKPAENDGILKSEEIGTFTVVGLPLEEGKESIKFNLELKDIKFYLAKPKEEKAPDQKEIDPETGEEKIIPGEVTLIKDVKIDNVTKEFTVKAPVTTTTKPKNTSAKVTGFTAKNATMKPAFDKTINNYKFYIEKDTIKQITIAYTTEETGVSLEVECTEGCTPDSTTPNKLNLSVGRNEAVFKFTSEDGKNTEEYKLTIYRGKTTDGSVFLSDLLVKDNQIKEKFDRELIDYTMEVEYEIENLEIDAIPEDENAKITIKGDKNLEVGENVVTITVVSAENENEKRIYNITVTRKEFKEEEQKTTVAVIEKQEENKKTNLPLIIGLAVGSTLIIGVAAYFIFFYKKKEENKEVETTTEEPNETVEETKNPFVDEDVEPTSVDQALKDLMSTKELEIKEEPKE